MRFKLSSDAQKYISSQDKETTKRIYNHLRDATKNPPIGDILLFMLSGEPMIPEKPSDKDLTDEERAAFETAEREYERGETVDFEEYLAERGIAV
jgi:transcriptional regulator of met regulon